METLKDLVERYGANGFVVADAGNGCGFGEEGQFTVWDEETKAEYGNITLRKLKKPHRSVDGVECHYVSEWIEAGEGDNPYRYRVYF